MEQDPDAIVAFYEEELRRAFRELLYQTRMHHYVAVPVGLAVALAGIAISLALAPHPMTAIAASLVGGEITWLTTAWGIRRFRTHQDLERMTWNLCVWASLQGIPPERLLHYLNAWAPNLHRGLLARPFTDVSDQAGSEVADLIERYSRSISAGYTAPKPPKLGKRSSNAPA